ncbi:MAG: alpha-glucan family phosphorylase [Bacteroidota bacterium]|nr:alpha-glucan family phosphorylase [Bacteroidota bacterium]
MRKPDYLFEVSWEVCNKVGGIHTVISTKALNVVKEMADQYITIGPDVWRESGEHPEFEEDGTLFPDWREHAAREGIRVRIGRWKIAGRPIAVVLDFTTFIHRKDEIFKNLWESYKLDSISGHWDYIEPALFGYAAGQAIESFSRYYDQEKKNLVAHFHEWQTGAGLLYLEKYQPTVGTVFTTHATTVGRSIAGNMQSLYSQMEHLNGDQKARELNVVSKHSMEKLAATHADAFTTVSELTAKECLRFHERMVDEVLPNGFEDRFVPDEKSFGKSRALAREKMLQVASALTGDPLPEDTLLMATSGRYEFRNKGIDLFIDALGELNRNSNCPGKAVAFLLIPANHYGPYRELLESMNKGSQEDLGQNHLTHNLHYEEHDQILNRIKSNGLNNSPDDRVKVIFVPSYLNGNDGIFNLAYYDVLIGLDLTVFPSYYEPWGYTPLESLAFSVPTVTTSLTGFGLWVNNKYRKEVPGITVIPRDDFNDGEVVKGISQAIANNCKHGGKEREPSREGAHAISRIALWDNLIRYYWQAYDKALQSAEGKEIVYYEKERIEKLPETEQALVDIHPYWRRVLVQQNIPEKLEPLEELSRNLWWSWTQDAIDLFASIDPEMWAEVHENPVELLERLPYDTLKKLETDNDFIQNLQKVYGAFESYMAEKPKAGMPGISYFSMEYGIHNSLKTFSGGLGLLAGDYLKEASDYNMPLVGVGLLYRYGYFRQVISAGGEQVALSDAQDFSRLPVTPVRDEHGNWKNIQIVLPGRTLFARIWRVQVGRIPLYLLDTDYEANQEGDRGITHSLYGGDNENRLRQEILLGIGGIRALRSIGLDTDLYHCNEGHAAFTSLERLREYIQNGNMTFPEAVELVRASSLFTTHTPVPAGHDSFEEDLLRTYVAHYPERLKITWDHFMNLGRFHPNHKDEKFSMSVLAVKLSQEVNGVSKLHGEVSKDMFTGLWPGYMTDELHIGYVTNGVHLPTWLGPEWKKLYERTFGADCYLRQEDREMWKKIKQVPEKEIWNLKSQEREGLINYIKERLSLVSTRVMDNPGQMLEISTALNKDALTIGFARRFATYKRAHLLFRDLDRLSRIVNNPEKPVQFVFAGKAHPRDIPGQDLIKMIVEISKKPEFIGKIVFLQNYDIQLAKRLVRGVDIWLNTPTRPLEASGTSGEKAVMNGTMHFSVLDGWWAEGYREDAGWMLPIERSFNNQELQDELDAERIYTLLENNIVEKFYSRDKENVPVQWVGMIRNTIASVAPEFTMNRMLRDYIDRFYLKLSKRSKVLKKKENLLPKELALWKHRILEQWKNIKVVEYDFPDITREEFVAGNTYTGKVVLDLNGLSAEEIGLEMVHTNSSSGNEPQVFRGRQEFKCTRMEGSLAEYTFVQEVSEPGVFDIGFRIFPKHEHIPHRMDFPLVRWI